VTVPYQLRLSRQQEKIFAFLLAQSKPSRDQIMNHLHPIIVELQPDIKLIDVQICKMRRKLERFDITICTYHGRGYYISPEDKAKVAALLAAETTVAA
jgi:two-component system cell cycle response regulator CtrA